MADGDAQVRPPFYAKAAAASIGATLTGLTMTPFDVVKTRLQTQVPTSQIPKPPLPPNTCCLPSSANCVRSMSSLAYSASSASSSFTSSASAQFAKHALRSNAHAPIPPSNGNFVCLWDAYGMRTQRVSGFGDAIMKVWAAEGARGLWKGVGTTLLIAVPSQTAYMLTYDTLLHSIPNVLPSISQSSIISPLIPLTSGILARTAISTCASPLELLRTRLQSTPLSPTTPHTLRSVLRSISSMVRAEGPLSLWKGLSATLWRDVPFSGLYWALYETSKGVFEQNGYAGAGVAFVCGATSGTTAAIITSPFDVIKTRRQALLLPNPGLVDGASSIVSATKRAADTRTFSLALQIMRTEGYKALYAGLTPRIAKIAPACGIMIASYEGLGAFLARSL